MCAELYVRSTDVYVVCQKNKKSRNCIKICNCLSKKYLLVKNTARKFFSSQKRVSIVRILFLAGSCVLEKNRNHVWSVCRIKTNKKNPKLWSIKLKFNFVQFRVGFQVVILEHASYYCVNLNLCTFVLYKIFWDIVFVKIFRFNSVDIQIQVDIKKVRNNSLKKSRDCNSIVLHDLSKFVVSNYDSDWHQKNHIRIFFKKKSRDRNCNTIVFHDFSKFVLSYY